MRYGYLLILLSAAALLTGCDSFRRLAGRPVSAEIEAKRAEIALKEEAEAAARKAREDSLKMVEKAAADSVAAVDSLSGMKGILLPPQRVGGIVRDDAPRRFYIIVGSFSHRENAERFARTFSDKGYSTTIISFRSGFKAVGLDGTDKIAEAYSSFMKIKAEPECPDGVWILVNE